MHQAPIPEMSALVCFAFSPFRNYSRSLTYSGNALRVTQEAPKLVTRFGPVGSSTFRTRCWNKMRQPNAKSQKKWQRAHAMTCEKSPCHRVTIERKRHRWWEVRGLHKKKASSNPWETHGKPWEDHRRLYQDRNMFNEGMPIATSQKIQWQRETPRHVRSPPVIK